MMTLIGILNDFDYQINSRIISCTNWIQQSVSNKFSPRTATKKKCHFLKEKKKGSIAEGRIFRVLNGKLKQESRDAVLYYDPSFGQARTAREDTMVLRQTIDLPSNGWIHPRDLPFLMFVGSQDYRQSSDKRNVLQMIGFEEVGTQWNMGHVESTRFYFDEEYAFEALYLTRNNIPQETDPEAKRVYSISIWI